MHFKILGVAEGKTTHSHPERLAFSGKENMTFNGCK